MNGFKPQYTTNHGRWRQDAAGAWHFDSEAGGHIENAASHAQATRPVAPCWFWFNGTPAPMVADETHLQLKARWYAWRDDFQKHDGTFLKTLSTFSGGAR